MKNIIIDEKERARILEFFPEALSKAIDSYHAFMNQSIETNDAKKFSDHHKAAQVAISHIELLMELADKANIPNGNGDGMELAALIQQASAEVEKYNLGNMAEEQDE